MDGMGWDMLAVGVGGVYGMLKVMQIWMSVGWAHGGCCTYMYVHMQYINHNYDTSCEVGQIDRSFSRGGVYRVVWKLHYIRFIYLFIFFWPGGQGSSMMLCDTDIHCDVIISGGQ